MKPSFSRPIDHIVPRNAGGSDDLSNLQALCYSCNAMKRGRDTTDFRGMASRYRERADGCIFCAIAAGRARIAASVSPWIGARIATELLWHRFCRSRERLDVRCAFRGTHPATQRCFS
jgi:hypothetical protein